MTPHTPNEISHLIAGALSPLTEQEVTVRGTLHDLHLGHRWGRGRLVQDDPHIAGTSIARLDFGLPGYQARAIAATQLRAELQSSTRPTNQGNLTVDFANIRTIALIHPANGSAGKTDALASLHDELNGQHLSTPFVNTIGVPMSGPHALRSLETTLATQTLSADVILIVRGGGSAADLTMWDHARTCTLLATCTTPIALGIGHTTDTPNAELTVYHAARTPTAAGRWLGEQIRLATAPRPPLVPSLSPPPPRPGPPPPQPQRRTNWSWAATVIAAILVVVITLAVLGALR